MNHLTNDVLWSVAREPAPLDVQVHLASCDHCRAELESVKFAQSVLQEPPSPMPVLPELWARRIGAVLRRAAEKQAEETSETSSWWPFKWRPVWALAPLAAALLAFAAYELQLPAASSEQPSTVAKNEPVVAPGVAPHAPAPAFAKKLTASVTSSRNARAGQAKPLEKSQQLEEGSTVATSKGGALWMKLPDGSRAGLTGASQVQLSKLEEKAVTLDVTQGSLVVVARHDTTRELRVRAGDLEVIDVGTRFLVSKDDKRTLVAVEEGEVEVATPGRRIPVHAGQAVEWRGGKLTQEAWAPMADEPKVAAPPAGSRSAPTIAPEDDTPPIAPLPGGEKKNVPPAAAVEPAAAPATPEADEWATPENLKTAAANVPAAPASPAPEPAPVAQQQAAAAAAGPGPTVEGGDEQGDDGFLKRVERSVKKLANGLVSATRSREDRAGDITRLSADGRTCSEAISRADGWLSESVPRGESFNLRKSVLRAKLHCLEYQGRTGDAVETKRLLQKL